LRSAGALCPASQKTRVEFGAILSPPDVLGKNLTVLLATSERDP
jgi:hypothetical protein